MAVNEEDAKAAYARAEKGLMSAIVALERAENAGWEMAPQTIISVESALEQLREDSP